MIDHIMKSSLNPVIFLLERSGESVTRFGGWGCNWEVSLNCYRGAFTLEESQVVLVKSYPSPPTHPTPLLLPHSCLLLFPT